MVGILLINLILFMYLYILVINNLSDLRNSTNPKALLLCCILKMTVVWFLFSAIYSYYVYLKIFTKIQFLLKESFFLIFAFFFKNSI
jgi:hypothetical protein